eukprot:TRINITY_DN7736_c0_g1_i2.p1 TRINITY_DN7736_c0_g1~~TRINITY_DN7736_c0_g1_i2.p1  ORF type:complete len:710 (+),score=335.64 TRINITY_DN7736_c0_g1_i2:81-2132(+)
MVRSNVSKKKSMKKFVAGGGLDQKKHFEKKMKPVIKKMQGAESRRIDREEEKNASAERQHMEDVRRLQEIDPELNEYVKKNDPDFGDAVEDEIEAELEGDEDAPSDAEEDMVPEDDNVLDIEQVEADFAAIQDLTKRNIKALKRCITYLTAAAARGYLGVGDAGGEEVEGPAIKTTELFNLIVSEAVVSVPEALDTYLDRAGKQGKPPHKCEYWDKFRSAVRMFISALAQLLTSQGLPDALAAHVLKHAMPVVEYGYTHTGAMRALLKAGLHFVAHTNEKVQLMAFLLVREMAKPGKLPPPFTDVCMKGMYLTFVKNTRSFSFETYNTVSFVMNECVELFGVDLASAYQHIFMYVRQLAVYLKTALQSGAGEEAFRHVYNWQYINSLRLWSMTVARYNDEKELFPLVYPIAQIACGVVELFPAPKTFPLHLIVISIINHLSRMSGTYIPVSGYLLRILSSPDFSKTYKNTDGRPVDLMFMLRAKKADLASIPYQTAVFNEAIYLLSEHLAIQSHTLGFPELVFPVLARLKKLQKEVSFPKWRQSVTSLVQKIKNNVAHIQSKRKSLAFGPSDVDKVTALEATIKEEVTPFMRAFRKEMERRDETRRMRLESMKEGKRKTVDEYADDEESGSEDLADLAQAEDVDDEASEDAPDDGSDFDPDQDEDDAPEPEEEPSAPKRRRKK